MRISKEDLALSSLRKWIPLALLLLALIMSADATYKEIIIGNGKYTISYDIKGDPVTPFEGKNYTFPGVRMYQVFLRDHQNRNRTTIEITSSGSGITESGSVRDLLDGFSDVREYSREINGRPTTVATGTHPDGVHKWTVFSYLDYKSRNGYYTTQVQVWCSLPEKDAGDLMNSLHIGRRT